MGWGNSHLSSDSSHGNGGLSWKLQQLSGKKASANNTVNTDVLTDVGFLEYSVGNAVDGLGRILQP